MQAAPQPTEAAATVAATPSSPSTAATQHLPPQCRMRLMKELSAMQRQQHPNLLVACLEDNLLEWHFCLHSLPSDTPFSGGYYHGKLLLTSMYPNAPPGIMLMTPSGRFSTNQRLCLSMSDFHAETWSPLWTLETVLIGLISFMIDEHEPATYGSITTTKEEKQRLAAASLQFNMRDTVF
jgi:ubiquitin-conjugating enzyme E2 J2